MSSGMEIKSQQQQQQQIVDIHIQLKYSLNKIKWNQQHLHSIQTEY